MIQPLVEHPACQGKYSEESWTDSAPTPIMVLSKAKGKHCQKPHCHSGVVDHLRPSGQWQAMLLFQR